MITFKAKNREINKEVVSTILNQNENLTLL